MTEGNAPTKNAIPHMEKGHTIEYSDLYDAYYCRDCNEWQEAKCKDPECEECTERPEQPLP